jgi:hypothetical protein
MTSASRPSLLCVALALALAAAFWFIGSAPGSATDAPRAAGQRRAAQDAAPRR